ncbi:carboxypeptidase-like regulatory domain-containing protein [Pedobacter frigiditerrae]|uniref:carboxypeptidase-like regulatory domain-containing protein n=1 Tax=Pedobacter frigiditerrae TaxID=2530452 RepID=UPI00292E904D|nr:carboxypeptidase-like regulatory domain-containing protein [Pedobacter frigiditerrae]
MKKRILICFLSALSLMSFSAFMSDDDPITLLLKKLEEFTKKFPQEKVHLHLDKPYYVMGEDIWLKAYVVTAEKNEPSNLSKILHIDLLDFDNKVAKKLILNIDSGKASGYLTIPDSLASGSYRIRAYTKYMRNFDNDFFFERKINLQNLTETIKPKTTKNNESIIDLQFFPEGGNMIYGIRSKIGVKAVDETGFGKNVTGYIIDETKQKVAVFETEHAGMGVFALSPVKGKNYKAVLINVDGTTSSFNFPKIEEQGYNLSINTSSENLTIKIASNSDLVKGQKLNLIAQCNGITYFTSTTNFDSPIFTAAIAKSRFPTGIIQFTLFENLKPVAERVVFINHKDQIKINLTEIKTKIQNNQSILNLTSTDINNNPIDGNFSVSVVDESKVLFNEDDENTILSNLLLSSDLKGFIEQPNYYFNNINDDKERQLDNLLLTQGWRRFNWGDLINNKDRSITYNVERSLEISGLITDLRNNPIANAKVVLMSTTNGFDLILDTVSNSMGRFSFDRLDIPDSINFIVQAKSGKGDKNVKLILDEEPTISVKKHFDRQLAFQSYIDNAKEQYNGLSQFSPEGIKLKTVNINKKKELKPIINIPNSKSRNGSADYVVPKERFKDKSGTMFELFFGVPGVKIEEGKIIRTIKNTTSIAPNFKGKQQPMLVILDGSPLASQESLGWMPASTVEGIEILISNYNTAIYDDGYWGVILITTKSGAVEPIINDPSFKTYNIAEISNYGFSASKQFYIPKFDPKNKDNKEPNAYTLRSTIYWNPNVNTDVNGKATINFPSSNAKSYKVTIEGMDSFGNLGRKTYTYPNNNKSL